jgi:selenocysteine lyase/cysteine desulfurase
MNRRKFLSGVGGAAGALLLPVARPGAAWSGSAVDDPQAAAPGSLPALGRLRGQFQLPDDYAYFNTAGLGASPRAVTDRVKAAMDRAEASPSAAHSEEDFARIRGKCAALLGPDCGPDEIALIGTATEGINLILNGLPLGSGDEVITSTHEHVALAIPLLHRMQTVGIGVRTFEPDLQSPAGSVDRIRALIGPKTRLIFVSHVTCTTGQVLPVWEIGRLAQEHRLWFALDGAQSLAQFPIDIHRTGAHFYTASCHKWLMGPKRTGILWVHRDRLADLSPTVVGAYSDASNSLAERRLVLHSGPQRFEYGTQNVALIYGLEAAIDLVQALGLEAIRDHNRALADACLAGLRTIPSVDLLSPSDAASRSAIVTFRVRGRNNREVATALGRRRLRVRSVTEAGLDAVRASFHVCNDQEQVRALSGEVGRIAAESPGGGRPPGLSDPAALV